MNNINTLVEKARHVDGSQNRAFHATEPNGSIQAVRTPSGQQRSLGPGNFLRLFDTSLNLDKCSAETSCIR